MKLSTPFKRVHFVGIGGIGMSAIAAMMRDLGFRVQGSDIADSPTIARLRKLGIPVAIGHDVKNISGADALVVSTATPKDNAEVAEARRRGIPVGHRSEMLAEVLRYKQGICISGTHGKTTTSSLIAAVLTAGGKKPSFIIGGILNAHRSNARLGRGPAVVVEADESDGSFLRLPASVSVVTNIDPEHMDFYHTFDAMKEAYKTFIRNTAFYGFSVVCADHPVVRAIVGDIKDKKIITYGFDKKADVHADNIRIGPGRLTFDAFVRQGDKFHKIKDLVLNQFGRHNIQNALAAVAVGRQMGVGDAAIKKAFRTFEGIQRRLTLRGFVDGAPVYDDYAHHPVEIEATLKALRDGCAGRIVAVFQPHRYTRLRDLWNDFLNCFAAADVVFVCDVYGAGEKAIPHVCAERFVQELQLHHPQAAYMPGFDALPHLIRQALRPGDTIVCLGAGSISAQSMALAAGLKGKK
ncbi:MAG: UDP-N-acetylmuramate--L-alanine ligase [Alphaproteobacteria bacterium]|nr:UDP-N-acetylmuramate--L-alanine ligase [Alphaproteobacteria bacterium]